MQSRKHSRRKKEAGGQSHVVAAILPYLHKLLHVPHGEVGEVLQKGLLHLDDRCFLMLLGIPLQSLEDDGPQEEVGEVADHQQTSLDLPTAHGSLQATARGRLMVSVGQ